MTAALPSSAPIPAGCDPWSTTTTPGTLPPTTPWDGGNCPHHGAYFTTGCVGCPNDGRPTYAQRRKAAA